MNILRADLIQGSDFKRQLSNYLNSSMYEEGYGHDKDNLPLMMHSSKWIEKCYNHMIVPRKKKGDSKERKRKGNRAYSFFDCCKTIHTIIGLE